MPKVNELGAVGEHWHLSERQVSQLGDYAQLLITVAKTLGLIGFAEGDVWQHIVRALLIGDALDDPAEPRPAAGAGLVIDVGSGAGLPGIPLAIASARPVILVEPRRRAVSFLEKAIRELDLDCVVLPVRAEEATADGYQERASHVAARALAAPNQAARICSPLVTEGGRVVLSASPQERGPLVLDQRLADLGLGPPVSVVLSGPLDITQRVHIIPKVRSIANRAPF